MNNIHETSTVERMNILDNRGRFPSELKVDVSSAFEFLLQILLQSQLIKREANIEIDNVVSPAGLSLLEKKTLKEVFQLLPVLQKRARNIVMEQAMSA